MSWDGDGIKRAVNSVLKNEWPDVVVVGHVERAYFDTSDRLATGRHDGAERDVIKSLSRRFIQEGKYSSKILRSSI